MSIVTSDEKEWRKISPYRKEWRKISPYRKEIEELSKKEDVWIDLRVKEIIDNCRHNNNTISGEPPNGDLYILCADCGLITDDYEDYI